MSDPQLCVTVTGRSGQEMRRAREAVEPVADLVEVRLDAMETPDVSAALEGRRRPVVVTCRPAWQGGRFTGTEQARHELLAAALRQGAEFVDVEAAAAFAPDIIRERAGRGVVLSLHTFGEMPRDLGERYRALLTTNVEVVKLAVEVRSLEDTAQLFELAETVGEGNGRGHVLIAMGGAGTASRVLAARLRNRWTYAGDGIAPGQLPVTRLLNDFRFRRIRSDAALYGVVGNPVAHSLSPAMHNAGFAALGLNAAYLALEARDARDFVQFARRMGLRGASVTAPFKVALLPYVDEIDPLAARVGAINTLLVRDGRWIGANTDVDGFLAPLADRIRLRRVRATVLGAGGAARAVAVALVDQGAHVTICARRLQAARQLAQAVGASAGRFPPQGGTWDVLVNATTAGSPADPANPIDGAPLDGEIVFDLVYAPAETKLLADARAAGCLTIGGIEMLIAQAERQFELWTGQKPPAGLFPSAVASTTPRADTAEHPV